jgi:hypothetical protein
MPNCCARTENTIKKEFAKIVAQIANRVQGLARINVFHAIRIDFL